MAANIPADPGLTLEQDTYQRLALLGYQIRAVNPDSDRFRTAPEYGRVRRQREEDGSTTVLPDPVDTIQISFSLDPLLLSQAVICGAPLASAVLPFPEADPLGCAPGSGGGLVVDPQFSLVVLVDDSDTVIVDDNDNYPIEA